MKRQKNIFALCLVLFLLLPLAACGAAGGYDGLLPQKDASYHDYFKKADEQNNSFYDANKFVENPFIRASETPVSTFSADVDTASYTYFRKMVGSADGSISRLISLTGDSIRTEEMINYFSYNYKGPKSGELFGINVEISDCPWNSEALLMCLGLKADTILPEGGNNLVFLIDVSGSMAADDKLPLLKTAFSHLTEQLTERDIISIVTYSGKEEVVLEGCEGNYGAKIQRAVNGLVASGSTNGQAGLQMAYNIAKKYYIEGGNNRIIMASDGDLNVGISTPEKLKDFISEKRDEGIYLSVLGFGTGNYRDANMEALADNGNGVYYYIDSVSEARKIFSTDLISTLYTVAEDVKLQITFDPEYIDSYRLVGYENRLLSEEDFNDDKKDAGEVGAGHSVTVCYELILTEKAKNNNSSPVAVKQNAVLPLSISSNTASASPAGSWMKLAIRYKNPGGSESILNEYTIGRANYTEKPGDDFKFICAVAELSMLLHRSSYLGNITIKDIYESLKALDLSDDIYKAEFRDLVAEFVRQ